MAYPYVYYPREYFDTISPWKDMKRCALAPDGTVVGYHHPDNTNLWEDGSSVDWSTYESNGWNCMVQIPKFYYRSELDTSSGEKKYRWLISDQPVFGFKIHPAFVRNGVEKDYIYFSAFEGSLIGGKLRSLPNKSVTASRRIVQFRADAQANGPGWEQQDFLSTCAIQLLYLIEYAHFDSQTMIGEGRVNQSSYANTGLSLSNGNHTFGNNQYMTYRGIENFWGNYWKWVDGININNHVAYIADYNFQSDKFDGHYKRVRFTNAKSDGFAMDIGWTEQDDFMFLPTVLGGSSSSYLYDYYYQSTGDRVALFGGNRSDGLNAGAFCWDLSYPSNVSHVSTATRLLYL